MKTTIPALIMLFALVGCADLMRNRTFISEMEHQTEGFFVAGDDFPVIAGDSGHAFRSREDVLKRTPASYRTSQETRYYRSIKDELMQKEQKLSEKEFRQYQDANSYLTSDSEKIYYLNLSTHEREKYLASHNIPNRNKKSRHNRYQSHRSTLIKRNLFQKEELFLGAAKNDVVQSWGRPSQIDVAGNPQHENERWTYYDNGEVKRIYFENGVIQGWEIE